MTISRIYNTSLALLTDMYQLTMAYGYWKLGRDQLDATFHLYFRTPPFGAGFTIAAGLETAVEYVRHFGFSQDDVQYLAGLVGNDQRPLFEHEFLDYLYNLKLTVDVDAIREGTVVFPNEPLLRVTGPMLQCQVLETPMLNIINFQTLIATKAARICMAAKNDSVLEFGLRRAQGPDGGVSASRAAYIGGCAATSNLLAGKLLGIPVRGTHAHSWVMSFDSELESFRAYADALPNNCVFLVDTIDTISGVKKAIEIGGQLKEQGHRLLGIRLDSGDLAYLSKTARGMLDEAGFTDASIVASNDLDESIIESLKLQGARIAVWGVGTKLATAYDQPALGGVYKLSAIRDQQGEWHPKIKLSEQAIKTSNPGRLMVRRYSRDKIAVADMVYDELLGQPDETIVDPLDPTRRRRLESDLVFEELLEPIIHRGQIDWVLPSIHDIRERTTVQLQQFHDGIKRQVNPHSYPIGLEQKLFECKSKLILQARGMADVS